MIWNVKILNVRVPALHAVHQHLYVQAVIKTNLYIYLVNTIVIIHVLEEDGMMLLITSVLRVMNHAEVVQMGVKNHVPHVTILYHSLELNAIKTVQNIMLPIKCPEIV